MNIDWSKAPEGYPIWIEDLKPDAWKDMGGWHKEEDDKYVDEDGRFWSKPEGSFYRVYRNPNESWTGTGLPPVGTVCEVFDRSPDEYWARHVGKVVTIVAHDITPSGSKVAVYSTLDDQGYKEYHGLVEACFRPIRTQEQIEAEERDREIQEMCDLLKAHRNSINGAMCEKLHGFGYRKQPKEGA